MPEHGTEAHQCVLMKHRNQHQPVIDVTDCTSALVGIALQDHISGRKVELLLSEHLGNIGTELTDNHPSPWISDHRKFVVLFTDDG